MSRKVARKMLNECKSASVGDEPRVEDTLTDLGKDFSPILWLVTTYLPFPLAQPNLDNLAIIAWTNREGKRQVFRLQQLICDKWITIGDFLNVPSSLIAGWKNNDPLECIRNVLNHWLDNPGGNYSTSWEGVYQLLEDAQLSEVVVPLKEALKNAHCELH